MAIKWNSSTVTAVKWNSSTVTAVYWQSTKVWPDGYGGGTFSYPIAGGLKTYKAGGNNYSSYDYDNDYTSGGNITMSHTFVHDATTYRWRLEFQNSINFSSFSKITISLDSQTYYRMTTDTTSQWAGDYICGQFYANILEVRYADTLLGTQLLEKGTEINSSNITVTKIQQVPSSPTINTLYNKSSTIEINISSITGSHYLRIYCNAVRTLSDSSQRTITAHITSISFT